jgi:hypothetical protein
MRDPFRPNSDSRLVREAQFAFVVILVLLGVLIYVAFYRVAHKKFHFHQIAQSAPLAQNIEDNTYSAKTPDATARIVEASKANQTNSSPGSASGSASSSSQTLRRPKNPSPPANRPQPVAPVAQTINAAVVIAPTPTPPRTSSASSGVAASEVAQAQFVEAPKPKPASTTVAQPAFDNDASSDFRPPEIKSNFGAGSTRELPSFGAPIKKEPVTNQPITKQLNTKESNTKEPIKKVSAPAPTPPPMGTPKTTSITPLLETESKPANDGSFVPPRKTTSNNTSALSHSFNLSQKPKSSTAPKTIAQSIAQSPPQSIPTTKPQPLGPNEYQVQATDSLWSIASNHYGDGRFFRALHAHNLGRITSTDQLQPGTAIVIPKIQQLIQRYPDLCPADQLVASVSNAEGDLDDEGPNTDYQRYEKKMDNRFHVTRTGDTLFDVARQRLGQASRYLEIFELNRFRIPQDVNHLTPLNPGLRLLLPE